jgi:AcrR family transcriptional regulator
MSRLSAVTASPPTEESAPPGGSAAAILRAARRAFALQPYAEVTLRGIAADAGVSAALILKLFGTKEQLFGAVADFGPAAQLLLDAPLDALGAHLVRTVVALRRTQNADPLLRVVFAIGRTDERAVLTRRFTEQLTDPLAARLSGPDARIRAELVLGQLLGLGVMMTIDRSGPASAAEPELLAALYGPSLQALLR